MSDKRLSVEERERLWKDIAEAICEDCGNRGNRGCHFLFGHTEPGAGLDLCRDACSYPCSYERLRTDHEALAARPVPEDVLEALERLKRERDWLAEKVAQVHYAMNEATGMPHGIRAEDKDNWLHLAAVVTDPSQEKED